MEKSLKYLLIGLLVVVSVAALTVGKRELESSGSNCYLPPGDCHGPASAATTEKAHVAREKVDGDCLSDTCYGIDGDFVRSERWKNFKNDIKYFPRSQDVTKVELDKTSDGGDWVVTLADPDGRKISYWIKGGSKSGGNVKSITPY